MLACRHCGLSRAICLQTYARQAPGMQSQLDTFYCNAGDLAKSKSGLWPGDQLTFSTASPYPGAHDAPPASVWQSARQLPTGASDSHPVNCTPASTKPLQLLLKDPPLNVPGLLRGIHPFLQFQAYSGVSASAYAKEESKTTMYLRTGLCSHLGSLPSQDHHGRLRVQQSGAPSARCQYYIPHSSGAGCPPPGTATAMKSPMRSCASPINTFVSAGKPDVAHLGADLSRMLQQLPPPVPMTGPQAASIPQLRASNQKQQALCVHAPQQQQPARQSGAGMQGRTALRPLVGSSALPQQSGMAMSSGTVTSMRGHAALSPFLGGSSPHAQHGAAPAISSQMQKPTFANHKRPGPQLQPQCPPAAQASTTALKVRYLQHARSILQLEPSFIVRTSLNHRPSSHWCH